MGGARAGGLPECFKGALDDRLCLCPGAGGLRRGYADQAGKTRSGVLAAKLGDDFMGLAYPAGAGETGSCKGPWDHVCLQV